MKTKSCPYCSEAIRKDNMKCFYASHPILSNERYANSVHHDKYEQIFKNHGRQDSHYIAHWTLPNVQNVEAADGFVVDMNHLDSVLKGNGVKKSQNGSLTIYETYVKTRVDGNEVEEKEYTFTVDRENPSRSEIKLYRMGSVTPDALLCPHCENFFPFNYFDMPSINILMVGPSSVGKTAFVLSMLRSNCKNIVGSPLKKDITLKMMPSMKKSCDPLHKKFDSDLARFEEYGILPGGTTRPLPPIFFDLVFQSGKDVIYETNLCIIDTEGERWTKEGAVVSQFVNCYDGLMYIVEPSQGTYQEEKDRTDNDLRPAIYDPHAIPPAEDASDDAQQGKKATASAVHIYNTHFRSYNQEINDNVPCAFVLTKLDQYLKGNSYSGKIDPDLPFWYKLIRSDSPVYARTTLFDFSETVYHNVAAFRFFKKYFPNMPTANCVFRHHNWFAVSAFSGEFKKGEWKDDKQNKVVADTYGTLDYVEAAQLEGALNVHEPLLWLLTEIIRKKSENPTGKHDDNRYDADDIGGYLSEDDMNVKTNDPFFIKAPDEYIRGDIEQ